jgi:hypothetical protein
MDAATLKSFEVDIPYILKRHSREAKGMTLNAIDQDGKGIGRTTGSGFAAAAGRFRSGFAVFPMPAHVLPGFRGSIFPGPLQNASIVCSRYQYPIFSQHGECRKGAVGCLSAGGDEVFNPYLSSRLILNGGQDVA